jgi:SAM-dependent methyltransferase
MSLSTFRRRLSFARWVVSRRLSRSDTSCPHCRSDRSRIAHTKAVILQVWRCADCGLLYRYPKADRHGLADFYQRRYAAFEAGLVTSLPRDQELHELVASDFAGSAWDQRERIRLLTETHAPPARMLDFGSSWGYFMAQARAAGYDVTGVELSRLRAAYGAEALGLRIETFPDPLDRFPDAGFDVVYTSHVLEHLPDLYETFGQFRRLLRRGGTLLVLVPNCAGGAARMLGARWGPFVNEAHTMAFTPEFFRRNLPHHGFDVTMPDDLDGEELVVAAIAR